MKTFLKPICFIFCVSFFIACNDDDISSIEEEDTEITDNSDTSEDTDPTDNSGDSNDNATLHKAFADFEDDVEIVLIDDTTVSIETDGLPNHTSPYWSPTHNLYASPTVATVSKMSPGYIDDFEGTYALQVSTNPQKASQTTAVNQLILDIKTLKKETH